MMERLFVAFVLCATFGISAQAFAQDEGAESTDIALEEETAQSDDTVDDADVSEESEGSADEAPEDSEPAEASADADEADEVDPAEAESAAAESAAAAAGAAGTAAALADEVEEEEDETYYEGRWVGALGVSGSFNLSSLNRVPGAPQGLSIGINASVNGVLDYLKGKHEWRNTLTANAGVLRSASDSLWVKTNDVLQIESGYYYAVTDWFGPFAEFTFKTAMFPLTIRHKEDTNFCYAGTSLSDCAAAVVGDPELERRDKQRRATGAFQPIELREKFGIFLRPLDKTSIRLSFRTGFAAQQFYVKSDSWMELNRNGAGTAILIDDLQTYGIFGWLADAQLRGYAKNESVLYGADVSLIVPFVDTAKGRRRADGVKNGVQANLGGFATFKISDWASLEVRGEAARVPQVTGNKWQTSLQTLLTFSYAVVGDLDTAREDASTLRGAADDFYGPDGSLEAP